MLFPCESGLRKNNLSFSRNDIGARYAFLGEKGKNDATRVRSDRKAKPVLFLERFDGIVRFIATNHNHGEIVSALVLVPQLLQMRQLLHARHAPGREEIDQDYLSALIRKREFLSFVGVDLKSRRDIPLFCKGLGV